MRREFIQEIKTARIKISYFHREISYFHREMEIAGKVAVQSI